MQTVYSANELRKKANVIRQDIVEMAFKAAGPSHPGPALSCTDIVTALYYNIMQIDPKNPDWEDRDRFILSKGHACPVWYACLAELGFFPKEWLLTLRHLDSHLQGSPSMNKTPGIDMTSGTLGNGLGAGLGMAIYLKRKHAKAFKRPHVYVIVGDGEIGEGAIWEAAAYAGGHGIDNLVCIVDYNHQQSCGSVESIMPITNLHGRWKSFGWNVLEMNGHNMEDILCKLEMAKNYQGKPTCIIAHTVKGKGVSYMENDNSWHQKTPTEEQYNIAMRELREELCQY